MRSLVFTLGLGLLTTLGVRAQEGSDVKKAPKFMVSANVNYGIRLADNPKGLPSSLENYVDDLKKGISFDISAYYMLNQRTGVGLKYNTFSSGNSLAAQDAIAPNGETGITNIEDNIRISFYGASVIYNLLEPGAHNVWIDGGLGYMHYNNDAYVNGDYTLSGGTIGFNAGISYQYEAFPGFSFGPKLSLYTGAISTINITGPNGYDEELSLDSDQRESLIRIDMGMGANYRF